MEGKEEELERIAENSIYGKGISYVTTRYCGKVFERYMKEGSVLELGPADGVMTEYLWNRWRRDYTAVDGASKFVKELKKRFPGIHGVRSFFEDYRPDNGKKYQNIILGHVLEHVENPEQILGLCRSWMEEDGRILCAVPNKRSLHRQAAVKMGLLESLGDYSEKDKRHGHRRIYDYDSFHELFVKTGWKVEARGGYWLKPLSDSQIEKNWGGGIVEAYLELGEEYPEIAGEIYIIAR